MSAVGTSHSRYAVWAAYFMIYVVWGSTYFFIGEAMQAIEPCVLGALRFSAAGLVMLTLAWISGEHVFHKRLILSSSICGALLLFADMLCVMLAQRYITTSLEAVLAASTLIWITLMDVPSWRHTLLRPRVALGVLGGMCGVVLLYRGHLTEQGAEAGRGILIFLIGTWAWALGSIFSKYRASEYEAVNAWSGTAWQMLSAAALFWICSGICGEAQRADWGQIPLRSWCMLGYLVVFGSVLAYTCYVWLLKIRPATEVGTHAYANPFIAILLGSFCGGEIITNSQWAGLAVILLSLFMVNIRKHTYGKETDS